MFKCIKPTLLNAKSQSVCIMIEKHLLVNSFHHDVVHQGDTFVSPTDFAKFYKAIWF